MTITHSDGECRAHKCLLQARSPVFRIMLSTAMVEASQNRIELSDASGVAVKAFLDFLYTDEWPVDAAQELNLEVVALAKKYEVKSLVEACSQHLINNLAASNVLDVLKVGYLHDLDRVKDAALSFATGNSKLFRDLHDTDTFDSLPKGLLVDLLAANSGKRRRRSSDETSPLEFPDGSDFSTLTVPQLRRACSERRLAREGTKQALIDRLQS